MKVEELQIELLQLRLQLLIKEQRCVKLKKEIGLLSGIAKSAEKSCSLCEITLQEKRSSG